MTHAAGTSAKPLVFVTVGTDHHRFDRIVEWIDRWLEEGGAEKADCFVQSGTASPPRVARWAAYLPYQEMEAKMRDAAVVVSHGAGATITLASYLGKKPVVVPRQHALGEHVDDHQVVFTRRIAAEGEVELAETEERLREILDGALVNGRALTAAGNRDRVAETVRRFEELVDSLFPDRANGTKTGRGDG